MEQIDMMRGGKPTPDPKKIKTCTHPQSERLYGGGSGEREYCRACGADLGD